MRNLIKNKDIDNLINSCSAVMRNSHRHVGLEAGWHQHLKSKKVGIVATSIAILYFDQINEECPEIEKALDFVVSKQKDDYGWPYISNTSENSNTESTCWALRALNLHKDKYANEINNGISWLLSKINMNLHIDQGWSFIGEPFPRTYNTCIVLRTLNELSQSGSIEFESALCWLCENQNKDGGWGEIAGKPSGIFYTAYTITTLIECGYVAHDQIIYNAVNWLESNIIKRGWNDPTINCCLEFIEADNDGKKSRTSFFHYTIPHIILAFINTGYKNNHIVFKGIRTLQSTNEYGYWKHPFLDDSSIKPIWAIYDSVLALCSFKETYKDWEKIHHFKFWNRKIRKIQNYNPIRLWDMINPKLITFISTTIFFLLLIFAVNKIYNLIKPEFLIKYKSTIDFGLSVLSSLTASAFVYGVSIFTRRNKSNL
jgi:hypothetical protein